MKYIKVKNPNSIISFIVRTEDDVKAGDTVVNAKGAKRTVTDETVDMAWVEAYGKGNIVEVKKFEKARKNSVKLYFYILGTSGSNPKGLYAEECEAIERPKTYKAAEKVFPTFLSTLRKDEEGKILGFDCLFLTKPNFEYAKETFRGRAEREITDKLKEVEKLKAELKMINESEEKENGKM